MDPFHWSCPYCNRDVIITDENSSEFSNGWNVHNKDGDLCMITRVIVCPNPTCREYVIRALLYKAQYHSPTDEWRPVGDRLIEWSLRPQSSARVFPSYIPVPILVDYVEACAIRELSPKASATLSRRCLQGIIRDYWGVSKPKLVDEIAAIETKVDPLTWKAIDAVRGVGNIGAHMEKDINLIIDVDPDEAALLIGLLEVLFRDWYIVRHEREEQLRRIVAMGDAKAAAKSKRAP